MKFIHYMLSFYFSITLVLALFFWPFIIFAGDTALVVFLYWILFVVFTAIGISLYNESKGHKS